jgi:glycosyltransferase involved in cell wall biosynthesis
MNTLSIIIPCLDEEDNIVQVLDAVSNLLYKNKIPCEIIVVDDQSKDETLSYAKKWVDENSKFNVHIIYKELERRGYGAAVKYGLAHATGEYAIFVSADLVDPISIIPEMYKLMCDGFDLVQCSRYLKKSDSSTIPFSYKFYQFFFRLAVGFALGEKIPDSTYAYKMFNRAKIQGMGISANRFNISPEIMFKAILANLKIKYIPGAQGVRKQGESKFYFRKEAIGFGMCLVRAYLHRKKYIYWF